MTSTKRFGLDNVAADVWPQRLLRIKDMTSYECQSHGKDVHYRKEKNPKYAIISYTWGRFRADNDPRAQTISVQNITWKIPRINPKTGFSSKELMNILRQINDNGFHYVWLDVACINQNGNDDYNQVGCQASIFARASASYVWLHQQENARNPVSIRTSIDALIEEISGTQDHDSQDRGSQDDSSQDDSSRDGGSQDSQDDDSQYEDSQDDDSQYDDSQDDDSQDDNTQDQVESSRGNNRART